MIKIEDLVYKINKYMHNFQQYKTVRSFEKKIFFTGKVTLDNSDKGQRDLLNDFKDFNKRPKPKNIEKKKLERDGVKSLNALYEVREMFHHVFRIGIFP